MITLLAWAAFAPSASAETRPRYGDTVVGSLLGKPVTFDPVLVTTQAEAQVVTLVFDTLYRVDDHGAVEPHLALGLPTVDAEDGVVRIDLRPGVLFHDRSTLGARDVALSLERLRRSARSGWLLSAVRSIRADGDQVVFALRRPTPELAALLASPMASITPRGRAPGQRPIGSGPFSFGRATHSARIRLNAWDQHFAGRPYVDRVELQWFDGPDAEARAYEVGALDLSLRGAVVFTGHKPKFSTARATGPATVLLYVGFGAGHQGAFANHHLRQALSLALGRESMRHLGSGERVVPTTSPIAVARGGKPTPRAALLAQPSAAQAALAKATAQVSQLRSRGRGTWEILVDTSRPDDREIAEKVVAALFSLGMKGRIVALPPEIYAGRVSRGSCDLYIGHLASLGSPPWVQLAAAFAAAGDAWAKNWLVGQPLAVDLAMLTFHQRLPILPLFHRSLHVHHRTSLHQVTFDPGGLIEFADTYAQGRRRGGRAARTDGRER